jgi:predicted kinase
MKLPELIVLTGKPGSGKTTVSEYMRAELGYTRLSGDDEMKWQYAQANPHADEGKWYDNITDGQKKAAWDRMFRKRDMYLARGCDVVIDTSGNTEEKRHSLLTAPVECKRYLIWLIMDPDSHRGIIEKDRRWGPDAIAEWEREYGWEDPKPGVGYELIEYRHMDLLYIKKDLWKRFA